ncbi:PREDICTED: uncharacterized protein LOC104803373, partial [Tarenaya hassleriana]|uniref:uncharacterized protein LOC104803373 n=1 Tax=Tarenaya hassleriana TaxID=28532 RepID=UPI00053CA43D
MTPFPLVYGKVCHLPVELEHKAYWAIKALNYDCKLQRRSESYISVTWKKFVWTHMRMRGSTRSEQRSGTTDIFSLEDLNKNVTSHGAVELDNGKGGSFLVNTQRLKPYNPGSINQKE